MSIFKSAFHQSRRVLAKLWLARHPSAEIIGVTGSYGKTNTATAIASVLSQKYSTLQTDLNLDTRFNIPITILKVRQHEKLVLEYGVDRLGEMNYHLFSARPKIAVITGISPVHADNSHMGSLENIIKEKGKLAKSVPKNGQVLINYDDPNARKISPVAGGQVFFYGKNRKFCEFWASHIKTGFSGTSFRFHFRNQTHNVKVGLVGRHHVYTALAAIGVGLLSDMKWKEILKGLQKLESLSGRGSIEQGPRETVLYNDSRRANPASAIAGLETLSELKAKRKIAVLGEMGELGDYEEEGHRQVGKKVGEVKPDYLICVGELTKYIAEEAKRKMKNERVIWVKDVFEAAGVLSGILKKGDLWYLKGSLLRHLERIPLILEGKEVDPDEISSHRYEVYS